VENELKIVCRNYLIIIYDETHLLTEKTNDPFELYITQRTSPSRHSNGMDFSGG
jgi:hypothetical protein